MKIEGYILDIDGTLLSSEAAHLMAWKRALSEYGVFKPDNEILSHFGKPTPIIAKQLAENADHQTAENIARQKTDYFIDEIERIPVYSGVNQVLSRIHEDGIPICFASSNYNRVIQAIYQAQHWEKIAVGFVGIEDVENTKPHPEMVLKAAAKMGVEPEKSAMVGDSLYDLKAGKAAGTRTIVVCTKLSYNDWLEHLPDVILNNFGDIIDKLPLNI
jgi:HAD superfamily hydrolase (TIGR01509 family)